MRFILSAIALAAIATPAAVAAQAAEDVVTVRIDFADIDLSKSEDRAKLEARVEAELREACTIEANSRYGFGRDIVDEKCIADARAAANAQVERVAAAEARSGGNVSAN